MSRNPLDRPMTRRSFVALGVAALTALPAWAVHEKWNGIRKIWEWYGSAHLPLSGRIARHFHYLDLDPAGVETFVEHFEQHHAPIGTFSPQAEWVFEQYLMSTDFFQNGADESRTVRFVAFYDPYLSPCWNPCVRWS